MLSAVAARRAAQAARQDTAQNLVEPESITKPPTPSPVSTPPLKPLSKRKPSAQAPNPSRKTKKKKVKHEKVRYFTGEDSFSQQHDVIVVDQDNSDESENDIDVSEGESLLLPPPSNLTVVERPTKGKKAWSPSRPLQDSSDEEEVDGGKDELTAWDTPLPARPSQMAVEQERPLLSTFEPNWNKNIFNFSSADIECLESSSVIGDSAVVFIMAPGETISLLGTYALTVLHGSISLAGVSLSPSHKTHHVFAPRSSPMPAMQCLQSNGRSMDPISGSFPNELLPFMKQDCAMLALRELNTGVEGLGRVCRIFDGVFEPSRWHRNHTTPDLGLAGVCMITRQHRDIHPFELPVTWDKALSAVVPSTITELQTIDNKAPVYLVKGPKKTGKSTFARTLLNRLSTRYQKVAFLECDLGQSEFTPAGMSAISIIEQPLFGPPFTHPTLPHLAHYIGSSTPRSSPSHYLSAIQALVQSYRLDIQSPIFDVSDEGDNRISDVIPLVVNTMGWNKGLGADLTRQIVGIIEPTDIFEIEAPTFDRGWPAIVPPHNDSFGEHNIRTHSLEPISPSVLANNYAPADHRVLSILSYFHAIYPSTQSGELQQITATSWNTVLPLCAHPPYEVDWTQALDKIYLTGAGTEDVVASEIERVLNCAMVGLVSCEPGAIDMDVDSDVSGNTVPYSQGAAPVLPSISTCHGLALIRAISPTSTHMHVLTPLPTDLLARCRVMVKGELELPVWGMLDFRSDSGETIAGVEKSKVPFLQWGKGEGIGGERRRVRRNLMRKGQM